MRSTKYNGLNSVECLNSVEPGLVCRVLGDANGEAGDGTAVGELKLMDLSRGVFGEVGGLRKRRGTEVDELSRFGLSGRFGVSSFREGERGRDAGRGGRSNTLPTPTGEEGRLLGRGTYASSIELGDLSTSAGSS